MNASSSYSGRRGESSLQQAINCSGHQSRDRRLALLLYTLYISTELLVSNLSISFLLSFKFVPSMQQLGQAVQSRGLMITHARVAKEQKLEHNEDGDPALIILSLGASALVVAAGLGTQVGEPKKLKFMHSFMYHSLLLFIRLQYLYISVNISVLDSFN